MRNPGPTEYVCDFCGVRATDPRTLGWSYGALTSSRQNWAVVVEKIETGCPAEGIPLEVERLERDICPECLNRLCREIQTDKGFLSKTRAE